MTLTRLSAARVHAIRDTAEDRIAGGVDKGTRRLLRLMTESAVSDANAGTLTAAASPDDPLTLGQSLGWWTGIVDQDIMAEVRAAWMGVYRATREGTITQTSIDGLDTYMIMVRDRLVQGLVPPLPEDAFNRVRVAVTEAAAQGWSRPQLASRIGAELSWDTRSSYWAGEKTRIDRDMDRILDSYGPPGTPGREQMRLNDPKIQAMRNDRNTVISNLERTESHWRTRATLIARTEATGANGYASLSALTDEGVVVKEWLSTNDARTRPDHQDVEPVPVGEPFMVGGEALMFPGDPAASAAQVANCRCCTVGGEGEELARQEGDDPTTTAREGTEWFTQETGDGSPWESRLYDLFDECPNAVRELNAGTASGRCAGFGSYLDYQDGGARRINRALRSGDIPTGLTERQVRGMSEFYETEALTLTEPTKVYRGVPKNVDPTQPDPAWMSVTLDPAQAQNFGSQVIESVLPQGSTYLPGHVSEFELILPPGTTLT